MKRIGKYTWKNYKRNQLYFGCTSNDQIFWIHFIHVCDFSFNFGFHHYLLR